MIHLCVPKIEAGIISLLLGGLLMGCPGSGGSNSSTPGSNPPLATSYTGTFTYHNHNARTGENLNETVLTWANVNQAQFGKKFSYPLDGIAYASPLYVANVLIPGQGGHNVVYVATEHDSVYAFDADGLIPTPLWKVSFINPPAVTTVPSADTGDCCDLTPEVGITGLIVPPGAHRPHLAEIGKDAGRQRRLCAAGEGAVHLAQGDGGGRVTQRVAR